MSLTYSDYKKQASLSSEANRSSSSETVGRELGSSDLVSIDFSVDLLVSMINVVGIVSDVLELMLVVGGVGGGVGTGGLRVGHLVNK